MIHKRIHALLGNVELQCRAASPRNCIRLTTGLIAMLARAGAPFSGNLYFAHLAWAGILWIGGILLWGIYLIRLI